MAAKDSELWLKDSQALTPVLSEYTTAVSLAKEVLEFLLYTCLDKTAEFFIIFSSKIDWKLRVDHLILIKSIRKGRVG